MQSVSDHLTKKQVILLVVLFAAALAGVVCARGTRGVLSAHYRVDTTAGRQAYLHTLGWDIDPMSEDVRETDVPEAFDRVTARYNALQREQGFDLMPYAGKHVSIVTYTLADEPDTFVVLWICDGIVIAGDVHTAAMDGWMKGIIQD